MEASAIVPLCFTILFLGPLGVSSHGRLRAPPSRSTMWRYGFPCPPNYNDHELNCGGFSNHWGRNKGRCGVCGDNYQSPQPRDNEGGGKYGRGVICREFSQGEIIEAKVEVTANHRGYFEFSLCPHNHPMEPASEDCFQVLQLADGSGTRWQLHDDVSPKTYTIPVRLPPDVTCTQCVFRWYWRSGNNWGMENGRGGLGLGPQETFIACSDIAIRPGEVRPISGSASGSNPWRPRPRVGGGRPVESATRRPTSIPVYRTTTTRPWSREESSEEREVGAGSHESREWEPEIAHDHAHTNTEVTSCRSAGLWRGASGMDQWCVANCARGYCPSSHCCCGAHC